MSANLAIDSTSKGSVAVPAKLLLEILKTFPEQPLTLPLKKTARWKSVQTLVNMLMHAGGESLEDPSVTLVPADVLATAISKTIFAAGNDDLRPVMSGLFSVFSRRICWQLMRTNCEVCAYRC
jgi:DNA polymerase-3 subunit beta